MKQRKSIDAEAQALSKEYFRISQSTEFNGQKLLSGQLDNVNLQGGVGANAVLSSGVGGAIGDGTFVAGTSYSLGGNPLSVVSGDFTGDGITDLVSVGASGRLLIGQGDGGFSAGETFATGGAPIRLISTDFNTDGVLDLAAVNYLA